MKRLVLSLLLAMAIASAGCQTTSGTATTDDDDKLEAVSTGLSIAGLAMVGTAVILLLWNNGYLRFDDAWTYQRVSTPGFGGPVNAFGTFVVEQFNRARFPQSSLQGRGAAGNVFRFLTGLLWPEELLQSARELAAFLTASATDAAGEEDEELGLEALLQAARANRAFQGDLARDRNADSWVSVMIAYDPERVSTVPELVPKGLGALAEALIIQFFVQFHPSEQACRRQLTVYGLEHQVGSRLIDGLIYLRGFCIYLPDFIRWITPRIEARAPGDFSAASEAANPASGGA